MATKAKPAAKEEVFDGQTIIKSAKYKRYADILRLVLNDGELYTHQQINDILTKTLKKPVTQAIN